MRLLGVPIIAVGLLAMYLGPRLSAAAYRMNDALAGRFPRGRLCKWARPPAGAVQEWFARHGPRWFIGPVWIWFGVLVVLQG